MFPLSLFDTEFSGKLTAEESAEVATQVAALTAAGLPLEAGLEALAEEIPGRRTARVLRRLAAQLSAGVPLEKAVESQGRQLPPHLRGLIVAGVRSGHLAEVMDEYVALARRQQDMRRRIGLSLAYPGILLIVMAILTVFLHMYVVGEFARIFREFGMRLPLVTELVLQSSRGMAWGFSVVVTVAAVLSLLGCWAPTNGWVSSALGVVPFVGAILRYSGLAQLSRLMAMFLEQKVPLPQALRLTAAGLHHAGLAAGCRQVAAEVEAGRPFDEALAANGRFSPGMTAMVGWGQRAGSVAGALGEVAETYDARSQSQCLLLSAIVPPIMFLGITALAGSVVFVGFLPLIDLIKKLS